MSIILNKGQTKLFHSFLVFFLLSTILTFNAKAQGLTGENSAWAIDSFAIVHHVDFEDNSLGIYGSHPEEWEDDWNSSFYHWNGWDKTSIIKKGNTQCMEIVYPENTYNGVNQGLDFTVPIPGPDADSIELYLSYDVMWKPGFDFVISGKTPGHMIVGEDWAGEHGGGPHYEEGGRFGLSWMDEDWIGTSNLRFYFYSHGFEGDYWGETQPWASPDDQWGRHFFYTSEEIWYNITIRMVCNTVNTPPAAGNSDGYAEGFINGKFMTRWDNIRMRNVDSIGINNLVIYTQFGGYDEMFAATRDEWCLADNYYIWTYGESVKSAPKYYERSDSNRVLHIPQAWTNAPLIYADNNEDDPEIDNEAPKIPSALNSDDKSSNSIDIQWNASTDNVAVTGYNVYLNGAQVGASTETTYSFTGINPSSEYLIEVAAYDAAGNESGKSSSITVITDDLFGSQPDDEAPQTPTGLYADNHSQNRINIQWYASTDNINVAGYNVYVNELNVGTSLETSFIFTDIDPSTEYSIEISAYDAEGNESSKSDPIVVLTDDIFSSEPDNEAPETPTGLFAETSMENSLEIQWNESNDNIAISGYRIYLNNEKAASTVNTTYTITGINSNMEYSITISAIDYAGNESIRSDAFQIGIEDFGPKVYIDPDNKNDNLEDGSFEHPFDSWKDVVWKEENKYLQKRGTMANESKIIVSSNNVFIGAYGEGELPIIWSTSEDYAFSFFAKSNITFKNLHVIAKNAFSSLYFLGDESDEININNSKFEGSVNGIRIIGGKNFTIQYNTFLANNEAIYSYAENTNIFYNIFQNNQDAVHVNGENSSAKIYNNVFYNNSTSVTTEYSDLALHNNIFYLAKDFDKALSFLGTKLISDYNIYYPQQDDFVTFNGEDFSDLSELRLMKNIDANSFSSDPLFVDAFKQNFDLIQGSPAVDAGKYVGITADLIGEKVPFGNSPDIGVVETNDVATNTPVTSSAQAIFPFQIYPNPSNGVFNVSIEKPEKQGASLSIQNVNGITILENQYSHMDINSEHAFDISELPNGIYIISVRTADNIYSKRIIKTM